MSPTIPVQEEAAVPAVVFKKNSPATAEGAVPVTFVSPLNVTASEYSVRLY